MKVSEEDLILRVGQDVTFRIFWTEEEVIFDLQPAKPLDAKRGTNIAGMQRQQGLVQKHAV